MTLPKGNPKIPEGINASEEHPLKEFLQLLVGVLLGLVVLVVTLGFLAGAMASLVPFSWESSLSPVVAMHVDGQQGDMDAAETALIELSQGLLASSLEIDVQGDDISSEVPPDALGFHLIDAEFPNAFATLGGQVVVTDELLDTVSSENGLAMVIAHEIAHVQLRHPIEAAGRGIVIQLTLSAVLGSSGNSMLGQVLSSGGALTSLSFSRDMELEADAWALAILRQHYGHVGGADEFFIAMDEEYSESAWLEFAQTHPSTEKRLDQIREAVIADRRSAALVELPAALVIEESADPE